ncbi:hypothetical protein FA13DRAFT_1797605 [Coprinellus micaceus]|uniref:Uncharacterized protein n=1 Tax=Coprinellus micaceus TaxID=71717 RepID=A0A4Y7SQB7_COPMI|nr:hypothetical protein FA13DRAFT_1797605 [Coprinellus micaceus]
MSTKAKQHFISQLRGKRGKAGGVRKYTFNDGEQAILDAGRKEWARGQVKAKELKDRLYNDIKDLYLKENEKRMDDWERDSLRRAVYTFVQLRCKQSFQGSAEVAKAKKKLMTKTGKPAFHVHQQAITLVSKKLSSADVAKLKVIASAWNLTGPPDDYKVRNALKKLDKRTQEFARDVLTQHGAIYFFMYAFKGADGGIQTGTQEWTNLFRGRSFDLEKRKQWDASGAFAIWDLWAKDFLLGEDGAAARSGPADLVNGKDPALFQLERNADDQPLLPNLDHKKFDKAAVHMKYSTWVAAVFRAFVSYWYGVGRGVVGRRVKVPWKFLKEHSITDWIAEEFVPEGSERLGDPDKDMNGLEGLLPLLEHWYERQESGEAEVLRFHHVAEPIPGQNKKYRRVLAADDPDDFKLPPRPDAVDSGSEEEDVVDNTEVRRAASEGSEAEGVAHTQQKGPQGGGGTRGRGSHEANLGAIAQAERSVQKGGAYAGTAGSNPSAREGHGPRRRRKSGLLGSPADSDHSGVDVAKTKPRRKARGTRIQSDDEAGPRAGAPDAPDAQYRFVEGGSKYEVEENFERDVAGILGEELPPGGNPVDRSPFDDEGVSPGPEIQADGPFSGRGPLLSFASHPPSEEEGSDTPLAQKANKSKNDDSDSDSHSDMDDITRMLDRIEQSEEEPEQPSSRGDPNARELTLGCRWNAGSDQSQGHDEDAKERHDQERRTGASGKAAAQGRNCHARQEESS